MLLFNLFLGFLGGLFRSFFFVSGCFDDFFFQFFLFDLSYDLVDGVTNPTGVRSLPYTLNGLTYTPNQIRKVNLHVAVRAEKLSTRLNNYMRDQVSTSVTIRDLASVNRYQ